MKKLFLCAALYLCCVCANAQFTLDLGVVGRVDSNPTFYFKKGVKPEHNFGNSVVYTTLESSFGEHLSLTWIAHWAETGADATIFKNTPELYKNTWRADCNSWTDFAYIDLTFGGFTLRGGKDCIAVGGFEYDPFDWECTYDMTSLHWQNTPAYQWGGSAIFTTASENTTFQLQAVSSSACERPWQNGMGQYFFKYTGSYGPIETSNSYGLMQTTPFGQKFDAVEMLNLGLRGTIAETVAIGAEWMNRRDFSAPLASARDFFGKSFKVLGTVDITPSEMFELHLMGGYERIGLASAIDAEWLEDADGYWTAGASVFYFPIKGSQDLRLHLTLAGNSIVDRGLSATIGILYNHTFHVVK